MRFKLFFTSMLFTQVSWALTIEDHRGQVELDLKKDWRYEQNILGLPHVFLTNDKPERTSLSLTLTGLEGVNLPVQDLKKNQLQYQTGRQKWAKKRAAEIEIFLPYSVTENSSKNKIHEIGMKYKMNGHDYFEKSYYIECPKSFVHLKLVGPQNELRQNEAHEMVRSLKCK